MSASTIQRTVGRKGEEVISETKFELGMTSTRFSATSDALKRVLKQVETVAPTHSTVLIHGETGSGKELIARAIHDATGAITSSSS